MTRCVGAFVVLAAGLGAVAAEEPQRHVEKDGGFSFVPPAGWKVKAMPGYKYQFAFGPVADRFAPNLNVADEEVKGTLDDYVANSLKVAEKVFKEFKLLKQDEFAAADKLVGTRLLFEHTFDGRRLRQTMFVFADGDRKLVVTGSALAKGGEKFDKAFDAALKTFRLEKK